MQFSTLAVSILSAASFANSAAVPSPESGMITGLCRDVSTRFYKFGECVSKTETFQHLNSSFWYQAAMHELCGTEMPQNLSISFRASDKPKSDVELKNELVWLYDNKPEVAAQQPLTDIEKRDFGLSQCLNACEIVQQGSNAVDNCWAVTGLTAAYSVCEVGCRFYYG